MTGKRVIGPILLLLGLSLATEAARKKWTTLEDCTLVRSEYFDGDSFHVRHGKDEYIFRLYFVDAPETDTTLEDRLAEQAAYWDVSEARARKMARRARRLTEQLLGGTFTVHTRWEDAGGSSDMPRYFAIVEAGRDDLAEALVEEGLARIHGATTDTPDGARADTVLRLLGNLEKKAQRKKRGVWAGDALDTRTDETVAEASEPVEPPVRPVWPNVPAVAFLRAEALINLERFEEADDALGDWLTRFPDHPQRVRAHFYRALAVAMQERFDQAIAEFNDWLKTYPNHDLLPTVRYWLAIAMYYNEQYAEAQPLFESYVETYPGTPYAPEAAYRAALCAYATEDYRRAADALDDWLESYADHPFQWEARVTHGDALAALGELDEARNAYLSVTEEAGPFYFLSLNQAVKVFKAMATPEAYRDMAAAFIRFVRDTPDAEQIPDAARHAGWALRQLGRTEEARALYWDIVDRHGNRREWEGFAPLFEDLSALYAGHVKTWTDELARRRREAAEAQRMTLAARLDAAAVHTGPRDDRPAAAEHFARSHRGDYLDADGMALAAEGWFAAGKTNEAEAILSRLVERYPVSYATPGAWTQLAVLSLQAADFSNALIRAEHALDLAAEPETYMRATFVKASALAREGRYDESEPLLAEVLAARSTPRELKPQALLALGLCKEQQNKWREAIPYYQRIYVLYAAYRDETAEAYLRSARAFEKLRDPEAAVRTYREMLASERLEGHAGLDEARRRLEKLES